MTGNELRQKFLQFFAGKDHLILPSYPLVPDNDPSLLLIGAGMAPFKPFFTGKMKPPHLRIATSQRCIRTGDIENVGRTARHHTFFEMLGNFSFGDYFKKEAIAWGWEFVTKELGLDPEKLWVTIYTDDDEAFRIWNKDIGLAPERIIRMEDNFWEIGTGPCGPCSEIYVDLGEERGCGKPDCAVGCNCDRYLEIWNLVFTQFNRNDDGTYTPLEKKNIDTGAGLERIASVLQNKRSNFETDLLFPIIEHTMKVAGVEYGKQARTDVSLKVIADHVRSVTVMISDGILPSNEGRGYVLRRLLRRAVRHGRLLGIEQAFLADIVDVVAEIFRLPYPDIGEKRDYIKKIIQLEEARFSETLAQGTELLSQQIETLKANGGDTLDGAVIFKLYDTFGFPWELTDEILSEQGLKLDKAGFDHAMSEQRERARAARQEEAAAVVIPDLSGLGTDKLRVDYSTTDATVVGMFREGRIVAETRDGEEVAVILDVTPFYAEGGGQVGDIGVLTGPLGKVEVSTTRKLPDGTVYHLGQVTEGFLKQGDSVKIDLDGDRRAASARNHTATHLLQAALRQVLGTHVNQAGSYVGPDRLRFDFSHFSAMTPEEIATVERKVNRAILTDTNVGTIETSQDMAKQMGAMALFGEKYGEKVRVVIVGDISKELCGGTHVNSTGEIGQFKIVGESSVGAGLRRIEAVTGLAALEYANQREAILEQAAQLLKTRPEELVGRLEISQNQTRELEREIAALQKQLSQGIVQELLQQVRDVKGIRYVAAAVTAPDMDELRSIADRIRDGIAGGVVVLGAVVGDKVNFVSMAGKEAVAHGVHAGNIVKEVSAAAGGGGGGRPEMAQAGGKKPEKLAEALALVASILEKQAK
jgi:alanyl-tRNA synthetase